MRTCISRWRCGQGPRYTVVIVGYTIAEIVKNRKVQDVLLIFSVVLLGVISFGLGRLSVMTDTDGGIALCEVPAQQVATVLSASSSEMTTQNLQPGTDAMGAGKGTYVASKNGTAYHFPWCSGAQRIKEENKIWFATKEEAKQAGYRPAGNCEGL
jgi:hypothetical protein